MFRLLVADLDSPSYFVASAAVELGFFKQQGVDVEFQFNVKDGPERLRDGRIDFFGGPAYAATRAFPAWRGARLLCALSQYSYWFMGVRADLDVKRGDINAVKGRRISSSSAIQLYGTEGKWGCYVVEIPGAGALNAEKHVYEEVYLVAEGRGTTEVWLEGESKKHVFEWQKGSLFSIPVNAMHRLVNASSSPAVLIAGTTAPNLMNLINNTDFIFNAPYQFKDRFSGADDFYKYRDDIEPDPVRGLAMRRTNFVPDVINCDLPLDNRRSVGWRRVEPFMTGNTFYLWIGQHEVGRYSKAHAHTSAAVLICLKGNGYTYTWPEREGVTPWKDGKAEEVKRVDYEPFGMVSAAPGGARWFHQHFNASKEGFRLTAWFGPHNPGREPGPPGEKHTDYTAMDIPEGGSAIPYYMEDPYLREEFAAKLKAEGAENRMESDFYKKGTVVPKFVGA